MNHYRSFTEFPRHVQAALAASQQDMQANIDVLTKYFAPLTDRLFVGSSFGGRSQAEGAYEDDGNTPAAGTEYRCAWFHCLKLEDPLLWPTYGTFYNGHHRYCVAHAASIKVRDRDGSIRRTSTEIQVGLWRELRPERVYLNMNTGALRLGVLGMADLVEQVTRVRNRIRLEERLGELLVPRV